MPGVSFCSFLGSIYFKVLHCRTLFLFVVLRSADKYAFLIRYYCSTFWVITPLSLGAALYCIGPHQYVPECALCACESNY